MSRLSKSSCQKPGSVAACGVRALFFAAVLATGIAPATAQDGTVETPAVDPSALEAQDIIDRALETNSFGFQSGEAVMTLLIEDDSGTSRSRQIAVRAMDEGDESRALVRVQSPPELAGQSFLFREQTGGEDDVWIYMPALDDSARRISGAQKNGSFMGTHLTYADLESRDMVDASVTRLPDETIGEFNVFVIDAVPDPEVSEYGSIRVWIRHGDFIPLRTRYFDDSGNEVQTLFTEQVGDVDGRPYASRMTLRPVDGGATTVIIDSLDFDAAIDAAEFTQHNLVN